MTEIERKLIVLNNIQKEMYPSLVDAEIRKKYSISDELAILRQRDAKPEEFAEYNAYVEQCKFKIKKELGIA